MSLNAIAHLLVNIQGMKIVDRDLLLAASKERAGTNSLSSLLSQTKKAEVGWYLLFRNILMKEKLPSHVKMSTFLSRLK